MSQVTMASDWQVSEWFNAKAPLHLAQLRGQVVLLHAFQMLCPGCVSHAVPQAERVHREYAREGVTVIGLHTVFEHHAAMTPVALEAFLHEYRITHPVGVDLAGAGEPLPLTMRRYGMQGTPTLLLIDRALVASTRALGIASSGEHPHSGDSDTNCQHIFAAVMPHCCLSINGHPCPLWIRYAKTWFCCAHIFNDLRLRK